MYLQLRYNILVFIKLANSFNNRANQSGTYYLWFAILIPVLLMIAGNLYFNLTRSNLRMEMQSAADTSAIVAAHVLCAKQSCYEDAIQAAVQSLNQYIIRNNRKTSLNLEVFTEESTEEGIPYWYNEDSKIKVRIERGLWVDTQSGLADYLSCPDNANGQRFCFESLEGNWQASNPNIPAFVIANAVQVTIETDDIASGLLSAIGFGGINMQKSSVALAGNPENIPVDVAPFALPICSLVSELSDKYTNTQETKDMFEDSGFCFGDRYFTGTSRHCSSEDEDCLIAPSFNWYPYLGNPNDPEVIAYAQSGASFIDQMFYKDYRDHYGVIGRPYQTLSEIQNDLNFTFDASGFIKKLSSTNPYFSTRIGDKFKILKDGINVGEVMGVTDDITPTNIGESKVNELIWQRIIGKLPDDLNTKLADEDTADSLDPEIYPSKKFPDISPDRDNEITNPRYGDTNLKGIFEGARGGMDLTFKGEPAKGGFCNSKRLSMMGRFGQTINKYYYDQARLGIIFDKFYKPYFIDKAFISILTVEIMNGMPDFFEIYVQPTTAAQRSKFIEIASNPSRSKCLFEQMTLSMRSFFQISFVYRNKPAPPTPIITDPDYYIDWLNFITDASAKEFVNTYGSVFDVPVWSVKVPVIAEPGTNGSYCKGTGTALKDPVISAEKNYVVVGFVDMNIFDTDISNMPPRFPYQEENCNWQDTNDPSGVGNCRLCLPGVNSANMNNATVFTDNINEYYGYPPVLKSSPGGGAFFNHFTTPYNAYPNASVYGFSNIDTASSTPFSSNGNVQIDRNPTQCNLIRARVSCDNKIISSIINSSSDDLMKFAKIVK
jgi:hypothetical protein